MNVITDSSGQPLMLEKINLGQKYSCLTLREVVINGVRLPPGSLMAVVRDEALESSFGLDDCRGFEFLRLTTLAVSPANRARAFGRHYDFQGANKMPGFDVTTIDDFKKKVS